MSRRSKRCDPSGPFSRWSIPAALRRRSCGATWPRPARRAALVTMFQMLARPLAPGGKSRSVLQLDGAGLWAVRPGRRRQMSGASGGEFGVQLRVDNRRDSAEGQRPSEGLRRCGVACNACRSSTATGDRCPGLAGRRSAAPAISCALTPASPSRMTSSSLRPIGVSSSAFRRVP